MADRLAPVAPRIFEKIPSSRKVVYLTFDDGPYTNESPEGLDKVSGAPCVAPQPLYGAPFLGDEAPWP